MTLEIEERRHQ